MKIQLVKQHKGKYEIIRNCNHSEDVIIQKTRVKILNEFKKIDAVYVLEGLGQLAWIPIEATGNHEIFSQIFVGPEIPKESFGEDGLD